jgi:RNA-directed DNA polymerase
MQTSLRIIAEKARQDKRYRFQNLMNRLNDDFLLDTWRMMNRRSAVGVDQVSASDYEKNLRGNISKLVKRLKAQRYRAKLIKRVYIPKGDGKWRPLGLPATEDKLLQCAVARILNAIFDGDFEETSYGYRPNRSARRAVQDLTHKLQFGRYTYVVEADIKGFFDNIDHSWLLRMLAQRIDDRRLLRLISKWLRAGILDVTGSILHPATGTPQGGIVSPILANIYLHFVLDLWFSKVVKPRCQGDVYICRYADDFVCCFQLSRDADRFYGVLGQRLRKFGLVLSLEKTRIIKFSRFHKFKSRFDFLGFEFHWGLDRRAQSRVMRRTSRSKLRRSLHAFSDWCRRSRNFRLGKLFYLLSAKLQGYYNYYGLIGNLTSLSSFYFSALRILYKWLNRRSQRNSFNIAEFTAAVSRYHVPTPRITETNEGQLKLLPC